VDVGVGKAASITRNNSSPGPRRATIGWDAGMVMVA
jgi:hypothetical protein